MIRLVRQTVQRKALRQVMVDAGRPLSASEILEAAGRLVRGIGIATVYRNLKTMLEEGHVAAVDLPGAPGRFEIAGKEHHHHFHCEACNQVFEVDACVKGIDGMTPPGFELDRHEVVLYGRCPDCRCGAGN